MIRSLGKVFVKKYLDDCKKYDIEISNKFKSIIPTQVLLKSLSLLPHLQRGLYGPNFKLITKSVGSIELEDAMVSIKVSNFMIHTYQFRRGI
jgi:hypothetical protein